MFGFIGQIGYLKFFNYVGFIKFFLVIDNVLGISLVNWKNEIYDNIKISYFIRLGLI